MNQQPLFRADAFKEWEQIDPENWQKIALDLIDIFLRIAPDQYLQLKSSWQKSDWQQVSRIAHSLKSSCGNVGADLARSILDDLELNLLALNLSSAHHRMKDLEEYFELSLTKINEYRASLTQADRRAS